MLLPSTRPRHAYAGLAQDILLTSLCDDKSNGSVHVFLGSVAAGRKAQRPRSEIQRHLPRGS